MFSVHLVVLTWHFRDPLYWPGALGNQDCPLDWISNQSDTFLFDSINTGLYDFCSYIGCLHHHCSIHSTYNICMQYTSPCIDGQMIHTLISIQIRLASSRDKQPSTNGYRPQASWRWWLWPTVLPSHGRWERRPHCTQYTVNLCRLELYSSSKISP